MSRPLQFTTAKHSCCINTFITHVKGLDTPSVFCYHGVFGKRQNFKDKHGETTRLVKFFFEVLQFTDPTSAKPSCCINTFITHVKGLDTPSAFCYGVFGKRQNFKEKRAKNDAAVFGVSRPLQFTTAKHSCCINTYITHVKGLDTPSAFCYGVFGKRQNFKEKHSETT